MRDGVVQAKLLFMVVTMRVVLMVVMRVRRLVRLVRLVMVMLVVAMLVVVMVVVVMLVVVMTKHRRDRSGAVARDTGACSDPNDPCCTHAAD